MRIARKILHDYVRGRGFRGEFRAQISFLCTKTEFDAFLAAAPQELVHHPDGDRALADGA